jgi:phasin
MTEKSPYEIPAEMRDFAEKSVDQARKAFDGFMGAAQKTVDAMQGSADSARGHAEKSAHKAFTYAEQNVAAAFDLAQKLVRAKDPTEVMKHQAEFMQAQMAAFQKQMGDIGAVVQKATAEAMKKK